MKTKKWKQKNLKRKNWNKKLEAKKLKTKKFSSKKIKTKEIINKIIRNKKIINKNVLNKKILKWKKKPKNFKRQLKQKKCLEIPFSNYFNENTKKFSPSIHWMWFFFWKIDSIFDT